MPEQLATDLPTDLSLDAREGLPDGLRLLLAEFPRAGWAENPNFGGLVRFWLDRHLAFRRQTAVLRGAAEAVLDRRLEPRAFGARVARVRSEFLEHIHGHHSIEDAHFFPLLSAREARLARGFDVLEADHVALDAHLSAFARAANGALGALDRPVDLGREAGRLLEATGRLDRFLDRHLLDEEDLVVPVILRHGEAFLGH